MKLLTRPAFRGALAILLLTAICGCWSAEEINNRAFAMMMIVDESEDGQTEITLGFPLPNRMIPGSAGGGGGATTGDPYTFTTRKAKTISEAVELIQLDNSRTISFGQTRVIVVGRKFAEKGIDPVLEFVSRQPAFHLSSNLFITPNKATEVSQVPTIFERFIADILLKFITQKQTLDTTVKDFLMARYKGGDILLPLLSFSYKPEVGAADSSKMKHWMGTDGAAIMREGKMSKIVLTDEELRGALWISSQLDTSIVTSSSPTDGKEVTAVAQGIGTKILPVIKNGEISFKIESSASAYILSSSSDIDLKSQEALNQMQEAFQKNIEKRLRQVIDKTRKAKSDSFLMNQYLFWRYPKAWNRIKDEWRTYYSEKMPIDISVKITIKRTGGEIRSVNLQEYEEK